MKASFQWLSLLQELTFGRLLSRLGKTGTSSVLHSLLQEFKIELTLLREFKVQGCE